MIVYLATNTVNGMQYVGLTRRSNLQQRVSEHFAKARNTKKGSYKTLANAIRLYGENAFDFKILDRLNDLKGLSRAERYWIQKLNTRYPNGYNVKKGGCPTFQLSVGDIYEIDGKKYYGCGDLAENFSVSVHNIRYRLLRSNWTIRQAVGLDKPPEKKPTTSSSVCFGKNNFDSIKEACDYFGITTNAYFSRKRCGWSDEETFEIVSRKQPYTRTDTQIFVFGRNFRSISKAAEHYGLTPNCVTQRISNGWTTEQALGLSKRETINHKTKMFAGFKSISEASRHTGIGASTLSWRIRKGWTPEQALGIVPIKGNNQKTKGIIQC